MTLEIRIVQNKDAQEWDSFVEQSSYGTLFHHWGWLEAVKRHTGSTLVPLMATRNGLPVGVVPLFFQKKGFFRMVFSPPPHAGLFYLGPVLAGAGKDRQDHWEMDYQDFHQAVEEVIRTDLNPDYTSIALPPALTDPRPYSWSGYSVEPRYDYVTDLIPGEEALYSLLSKKQRQDINRSKKRGVSVDIGGKEEYVAVLDLMEDRYQAQDKPTTIPRQYFLDLYDIFKENFVVFTARFEDEIVTGLIDIQYKGCTSSWIGNPKPRGGSNLGSPNLLVGWEAIRHACQNHCTSYITLSAAGNERLHRYYSSQFDPALKIRFHAKKMSFTGQILEKGYVQMMKPFLGKMGSFTKRAKQPLCEKK